MVHGRWRDPRSVKHYLVQSIPTLVGLVAGIGRPPDLSDDNVDADKPTDVATDDDLSHRVPTRVPPVRLRESALLCRRMRSGADDVATCRYVEVEMSRKSGQGSAPLPNQIPPSPRGDASERAQEACADSGDISFAAHSMLGMVQFCSKLHSERIRVYAKRRMLRLWRRISRLRTLTSISGAIYRQSLLSRTIDAFFLCISRKRRMRKCERIVLRAVRRVHGRLCRRAIAAWHSYMRQRNSLRNRLRGWYLINAAWETWIKMWSESTIAACVHDRLLRLRAQQTCVAWRVITDLRMRFAVVRWKHLYRHMHLALLRWYRACLRHSMLPSARHRLLRESFDLWIVAVACSKESLLIL
ncbi:hypothetical protein PPROV_001064500 [Pycnococcus provasolii]|uniref:Sfi1 spindle body domain-containing protein n=1 Tax=Pycnococcus provasolii TaxID=41880 RepID=A0A830HY25_9CHLO|nr:hypothetical protein PPROV_001064500 [Pycnococcus provasolii]